MHRFIYVLLGLIWFSTTVFAQISKHSFGASVNNGAYIFPEKTYFDDPLGNIDPLVNPARTAYVFGLQGSHLKSSNKWLAWRTTFAASVTSKYQNLSKDFEGYLMRQNIRLHWLELGFGPMLTYQRKDYGFFLGGTLELVYSRNHRQFINEPYLSHVNWDDFPVPTVTAHLGYWQRIGNINSPWFLEIAFSRRHVSGIRILISDNVDPGPYWYNLSMGFRYEINE
jgi:hypothetical protein